MQTSSKNIHVDPVCWGLLKKMVVLGNALANMDVKCGAFEKAQKVLGRFPIRNATSSGAGVTRRVSVPSTVDESIEQALSACNQARRDGLTRLQLELLLPLIGATDLDDWPGGIQQQFKAARPVVSSLLGGLIERDSSAEKNDVNSYIADDGDAVGVWESEKVVIILFPNAECLEKVKTLDSNNNRLLLLVNPQWQGGQDVQAQWKATITSPPKPDSKNQYLEKELEEEIDARLARILGAQKQGKKHDRKRKKSTDFPGYLGSQSTFDKAKKHKKRAAVPSSSSSDSSSESSEEERRSKKRSKRHRHGKGKRKTRKSRSHRVDDSSSKDSSTDSSDSEDGHFYANKKNFYKANQYDFLEEKSKKVREFKEGGQSIKFETFSGISLVFCGRFPTWSVQVCYSGIRELSKYMTKTAFQDMHAQWKATTISLPKPDFTKEYSEKELEEEIDARLARILGAQKQGKKHDKKLIFLATWVVSRLPTKPRSTRSVQLKPASTVPSSSSSSDSSSESSEEERRSKKRSKRHRHGKGKRKTRKSKSRRVDDNSTEGTSTDSSDSEDGHFYANKKNFYKANQYDFLEDKSKKVREFKEGGQSIKFDTFSGYKDASKALSFIQQFDIAFAGGRYSEHSKIRRAASYFKGNACTWWSTLLLNKTAPVKWLKFKKLFISFWLMQEYERDIRAAWNHLRMTKRDTVDAYCERFWSAFLPASSFKKISFRVQLERFTLGLPTEIRDHCLEQKSASI
ncbi:hypothetical protein L7F22_067284 [Adiantum nelumboides]|nr:hypothetical protein [Adiantum nelumboides]